MIRVTVEVSRPTGQAIGIKEDLAQYLERYGDARVVSVDEVAPEQLTLAGQSPTVRIVKG